MADTKKLELEEVKGRTVKGLTLLVVREAVIKFIAIVGQLILVRLLLPEQFGVIAVFTLFINVGDLFTDVGLVAGVIRAEKRPSPEVVSTLFFIKMGLTSAVVLILFLLRPILSHLFPAILGADLRILTLLSLTLLVRPLRTLIYALLERELKYDLIPIVDIAGLVIYFVVAVTLALKGFGIWSLVWSVVAMEFGQVLILEVISPFVPRLSFKWSEAKPFLKFGAPLQANRLFSFMQLNTIPFLGGMLTNSRAVGLLDWGYNIASLPRALTDNVGRVSYASFSRIQDRLDILEKAIEESLSLLSLPIMFLVTSAIYFSRAAITIVIGSRWVDAAPALIWLLLSELFLAVVGILAQAVVARGRTKPLVGISFLSWVVQWVAVVILTRMFGFTGIAMGIAVGWAFQAVLLWHLVGRAQLKLSLRRTLGPTGLVFLVTLPAGLLLSRPSETDLTSLLLDLAAFALIYLVFAFLIARRTISQAISLLRSHLFS